MSRAPTTYIPPCEGCGLPGRYVWALAFRAQLFGGVYGILAHL